MFKLIPNPTFTTAVKLHVAGSDLPGEITVTFQYLNPTQLAAWQQKHGDKPIIDALAEIMTDWQGIEDKDGAPVPFNVANLTALITQYHAAANNITQGFIRELYGARLKN